MRVCYWTVAGKGGERRGGTVVYYSGETGWGVEEEDTRGKAAYADNALCLRNFIGGLISNTVYGFQ